MNPSKIKLKKMQQKWWWSYALLAVGIFLFTHGCSILNKNIQYALPIILFSLIMHQNSMNELGKRFFKKKITPTASLAMIVLLIVIAITSYYVEIEMTHIFILDIISIALYLLISALSLKLFNKN
ncbi:MAG: hypothetical protein ACERLG_01940 [Sedimentibacter sp.]